MASKPQPQKSKAHAKENQNSLSLSQQTELLRSVENKLDTRLEALEQKFSVVVKHHSGPLPAPDDTEQYERLLPGFTDRCLKLAEKEQGLSHGHIQRNQRHEFIYRMLTLGFVGSFMLLLLGSGIYAIFKGQETAGTFAIVTAALVPIFAKIVDALNSAKKSKEA